jgi:prepilin-type N-terminal cleavage/methylation domain-containing protein/prepilin-type processing-associated H-X9-DG protein
MKRPAFTLIELLIVAAILAAIAGLLLVAMGSALESSRRAACVSNLRQVGLAMHNYHGAHQAWPPAVIWSPPGEPLGSVPMGVIDRVARRGRTQDDTIFANWLAMLLPYLEQSVPSQPKRPISHADNRVLRESEVAVLKCPSDPYSTSDNKYERAMENRYARGNFAINVGPDGNCVAGTRVDGEPCVMGFIATRNQVWGSGVAGVNRSFRMQDVTDGLSHTVAINEIRAGVDPLDPRGAWALGQIGASILARHGEHDDAGGPNPASIGSEVFIGCKALTAKLGEAALAAERMACLVQELEMNLQSGSRSCHPGGVNVLLCDGSARFIANGIDGGIWHALHTRSSGETIQDF